MSPFGIYQCKASRLVPGFVCFPGSLVPFGTLLSIPQCIKKVNVSTLQHFKKGFWVFLCYLFCRLRRRSGERGCEDTSRSGRRARRPPAPPAFPASRENRKALSMLLPLLLMERFSGTLESDVLPALGRASTYEKGSKIIWHAWQCTCKTNIPSAKAWHMRNTPSSAASRPCGKRNRALCAMRSYQWPPSRQ